MTQKEMAAAKKFLFDLTLSKERFTSMQDNGLIYNTTSYRYEMMKVNNSKSAVDYIFYFKDFTKEEKLKLIKFFLKISDDKNTVATLSNRFGKELRYFENIKTPDDCTKEKKNLLGSLHRIRISVKGSGKIVFQFCDFKKFIEEDRMNKFPDYILNAFDIRKINGTV